MNVAIVREWLDHVEADLDAAWTCGRGPRARLDRAAYLVQQAAEKLVKAVLVSMDVDPPRAHDIGEIIAELRADAPFRDRLAALSDLTPYATAFRYPTPREPPPLPSLEWIGSRARGDGDEDSDYDLMVVVRDDAFDEILTSKWHFSSRASSVDVKTRRRACFDSRMGRVGTVEHEVACEGIQLHPPGANPLDFRRAQRQQPHPSPDVEIVAEWLARARWHLPGAKTLGEEFLKPPLSTCSRRQRT